MSNGDVAAWTSAVSGVFARIVAGISLVESNRTEAQVKVLTVKVNSTHIGRQHPVMIARGGNGGFAGDGGGPALAMSRTRHRTER